MRISIKDGRLYKNWKDVDIEIFRKQKIIKIIEVKEEIDLHNFLIRKSKNKTRMSLALEAATPNPIFDTIRISCPSIDFEDHFSYIIRVWQEAQEEVVKNMYFEESKGNSDKKKKVASMKSEIKASDPMTCMLSHPFEDDSRGNSLRKSLVSEQDEVFSMESLQKIQKCLISDQLLQTLNSYLNFTEMSFGVFYEKNGPKVRKVFEFDHKFVTEKFISEVIDDIAHNRARKHTIESIKVLKEFPNERTKVYREFDHFGE